MPKDMPQTQDGRYFVSKGRLWRRIDPSLSDTSRRAAAKVLMQARRDVGRATTAQEEQDARDRVDRAKRLLGERGPVWWDDSAPDETGKAPWNSSYAEWWSNLEPATRALGDPLA